MGNEKNRQNALRWIKTATDDFNAALVLHKAGSFAAGDPDIDDATILFHIESIRRNRT